LKRVLSALPEFILGWSEDSDGNLPQALQSRWLNTLGRHALLRHACQRRALDGGKFAEGHHLRAFPEIAQRQPGRFKSGAGDQLSARGNSLFLPVPDTVNDFQS